MKAEQMMQRCLFLAGLGRGKVKTNPMVGCVVEKDGQILSEGYHMAFGEAHAEVNALTNLQASDLKGATVYVSLEPCSHFGKTPPCAQLLIEKGVEKVQIAMLDPNPEVAGKGMAKLEAAGIHCSVGLLEDQAKALLETFSFSILNQRPYITLKWAQSKDGFLAGLNGSEKITGTEMDLMSHHFRFDVDAIAVGKTTAIQDRPSLNARFFAEKQLLKVCFSNQPITSYLPLRPSHLASDLFKLYQEYHVGHLLIEGGAKTISYFIENNLYNAIRVIEAQNLVLKQGVKAPSSNNQNLSMVDSFMVGNDRITLLSK